MRSTNCPKVKLTILISRLTLILVSFGQIIGVSATADASAEARHAVSLEDLKTIKDTEYLRLSPTGDKLAYVVNGHIWLASTKDRVPPLDLGRGAVPVWSPDGTRLAFYSEATGSLQLYYRVISSGFVRQLTYVQGGINPDPNTRLLGWTEDPLIYSWSPDGKHLVFASQVAVPGQERIRATGEQAQPTAADPLVLTRETPPDWTLAGIFRVGGFGEPVFANATIDWETHATLASAMTNELFVVDVDTEVVQQITRDRAIYFNPSWAPDGRSIVCASSEGRSLRGYGSGTTNIYAIDVSTGMKTALTHGAGDKRMPVWSPDGKWVAYLGGEHFGLQSVFLIGASGGTPQNLSSMLDRYVWDFVWESNSRSVLISYQDGVFRPIARIDIHTAHADLLTEDDESVRTHVSTSRFGDTAWEQTDGSSSGLLVVLEANKLLPRTVVDLNPQIKTWQLGKQEVIHWENHRGDAMEGILIKPARYEKGHPYPLIVDGYPGQSNSFKGYAMFGNQAWASHGYAVFWPDPRAPHVWMNPFESKSHDQAGKGSQGLDVMTDDVISGVDELVRRGIADRNRIGLYGFSNGGGVVNQLVTKTDRFRCAVSVAGATSVDWFRVFFLHTMNPMIPEMVGALPWDDPQEYVQLSALLRLNHVQTPMLLADGDNDADFLLNTIELYNGLRYLGRDVTFVRYPNQGHGFEGEALEDFWKREMAFFDNCLNPAVRLN